jgi:hypothetical protein
VTFDGDDSRNSIVESLTAGAGRFRFHGACADDRAFARRTWLSIVPDQQMLHHFVDAGVLEPSELGVLVKRNIPRSPDEAQAAEDSACFALEGL